VFAGSSSRYSNPQNHPLLHRFFDDDLETPAVLCGTFADYGFYVFKSMNYSVCAVFRDDREGTLVSNPSLICTVF
jgi:hypothetical protein